MSQTSNQTDLPTDAYSTASSGPRPLKSASITDPKKMLAISAAALLLGGSAWAISRKIAERTKEGHGSKPSSNASEEGTQQAGTGVLPSDIDVAGKVTDSMSFEQAFKAARNEVGVGGVFNWHGRWYNTFNQDEWSSLSLAQRQDYTEMIMGEQLPVKPYNIQTSHTQQASTASEPTLIEGHINGQRVMGLDFDHDGVIDTLVLEAEDGYMYRIVDASGDDGLDTLLRYDAFNGELVGAEKIDKPFVLSNDQLSDGLEASMSKEIVDSILEPDATVEMPVAPLEDITVDDSDHDNEPFMADAYGADDDTYVNNGDVHDMDE